jgi:hypothetical protein
MAAAVAAVPENSYFPCTRLGHAMGYETINVTPVTPRIGGEQHAGGARGKGGDHDHSHRL